ncbi:FAD-dependent oxidoreductase [uncultured Devosia sp.]|mgnify:CR=1 FL=1|uniref:FAD-dependent oxidoreductase n=1 Tax=uncultured Devosia sp. TaxID=211434 RepID=UPI00261A1F5C|nr:FAD-dependent oxidoreductase [uncultured Devosia sp.]
MSETDFDFAVFGSTPLAQLVAGLLAGTHDRKVLLIGESRASYRLPRGIDLSVAPITRPQTWALLSDTVPETARLVGRVSGRGGVLRVDPVFFAENPQAVEALLHIRHMAPGFGTAAEPVPQSSLGGNRSGAVFRDALRLNRPQLESGLEAWLADQKVARIAAQSVGIAEDGQAELVTDSGSYRARQAVLADDEAITAWLPLRQWPKQLRRIEHTAILTTPTRPLASSIMLELDSGVFLTQQPEGGVAAFGPGDRAWFSEHLQGLLGRERQIEQAGQTSYSGLATMDGAPAFGRVAGAGADIVVGTGSYGAFIAPALARWLAGTPSPLEAQWFDHHLVSRDGADRRLVEFSWTRGEPVR